MKKPAKFGIKLLFLGSFICLLIFWAIMEWPCVFRSVTGIPCICCGMSRAWISALQLDIAGAFRYHPMFWSVPILVLFFLFDGKLFSVAHLNFSILSFILLGWFLSYAIRLVTFLSGQCVI